MAIGGGDKKSGAMDVGGCSIRKVYSDVLLIWTSVFLCYACVHRFFFCAILPDSSIRRRSSSIRRRSTSSSRRRSSSISRRSISSSSRRRTSQSGGFRAVLPAKYYGGSSKSFEGTAGMTNFPIAYGDGESTNTARGNFNTTSARVGGTTCADMGP